MKTINGKNKMERQINFDDYICNVNHIKYNCSKCCMHPKRQLTTNSMKSGFKLCMRCGGVLKNDSR